MAAKSSAKSGAGALRRFDLRDELRELAADRRKRQAPFPAASAPPQGIADLRHEGVAGIAVRLSSMFPGLPGDTIQAALSELFRADPHCSRRQLADRAVALLLEMAPAPADGAPQSITSFEPRSFTSDDALDPSSPREWEASEPVPAPSAPPAEEPAAAPGGAEALDAVAAREELLDSQLAELLTLPTEALRPCVDTLVSILRRIALTPEDPVVRRLKLANRAFGARVGCHPVAVELLRMAGFQDSSEDGEAVIAFHGEPSSGDFLGLLEALSGIAEVLRAESESSDSPSPSSSSSARKPADTAAGSSAGGERPGGPREHIAELTERRLRDPRGFREAAAARRASNRVVGQLRRDQPGGAAPVAAPQRRAQHFNLADIDRMRVQGEIDSMPSYAQEYQQRQGPATSYGEMVSRSYDPELIARKAMDGTNRYRASKGMAPLRWNAGIAKIAREHAEQMARGEMPFSHDGFEQRVSRFPVAHQAAGENLALNSGAADVAGVAVDGWIKSPGHEKNLRGHFNLCGIGVARSSCGTFFLTQLFANAY